MTDTIEGTLSHAMLYAKHLNKCDPQYAAVAVLLELGISTKRAGFEYLKRSVVLFYDDPAQMITKGIYPAVGKYVTPEAGRVQVEQAIRSAISKAWKNRDDAIWKYYFPTDKSGNIPKPSNAEFISSIGRFLELWQGCCEEVGYEKS